MAKGRKTGGRQKGSLNKATAFSKDIINEVLATYTVSDKFAEDIAGLEPKERLDVMVKLMAFVTPKPQTVAIDLSTDKRITIEERLSALAEENE